MTTDVKCVQEATTLMIQRALNAKYAWEMLSVLVEMKYWLTQAFGEAEANLRLFINASHHWHACNLSLLNMSRGGNTSDCGIGY
jgi:hypothetical protein